MQVVLHKYVFSCLRVGSTPRINEKLSVFIRKCVENIEDTIQSKRKEDRAVGKAGLVERKTMNAFCSQTLLTLLLCPSVCRFLNGHKLKVNCLSPLKGL